MSNMSCEWSHGTSDLKVSHTSMRELHRSHSSVTMLLDLSVLSLEWSSLRSSGTIS